MVQTWERSGTYAHGFVVYPVAIWLIWRERTALAKTTPGLFLPGLAGVFLLSAVWFIGDLVNVQTLREFAFVASAPVLVWTLVGTPTARTIALPLVLTLFAWPFGEFLIPGLIDRTADFVVVALRMSGVPVFREGNQLAIPSGHWSVVDACSGLRYLIASVYGGSVFAYLNFRSWTRRALFLGVSILVPVVANWLRAYMIVMIGHLSDNRLAAGVDHIIYGWLFFGIVITIVFYVGARFSDLGQTRVRAQPERAISSKGICGSKAVAMATVGAVCLVAVGPVAALILDQRSAGRSGDVVLSLPAIAGGWQVDEGALTAWVPPFRNPTASVHQTYRQGNERTGLYVAYFRHQRSGSKLLTFMNTTLSDYGDWRASDQRTIDVPEDTGSFRVIEKQLHAPAQNLLVWQWYWVGGKVTVGVIDAKLAQARARLNGLGDDSAVVVTYSAYADDPASARDRIARLVHDLHPAIDQALRVAAGR